MMETVAEGIKPPGELEFKLSEIEPCLIGVFAKKSVRKGRTYGPFVGTKRKCDEVLDDTYSWEIKGPKGMRLYSVDASDPSKANWMRYVKSARSFEEQNMIATQYKRSIYYKALRPIVIGEELLCWYKNLPQRMGHAVDAEMSEGALNTSGESMTSGKSEDSPAKSAADGENFDRQMPILEKMDPSEMMPLELDSAMSAESENRTKVPTHLDVLGQGGEPDDKVAEPPLISPIYPSDGHHAAAFASITAGVDLGGVGDSDIQIQAPDVSSSDATSHFLSEDNMPELNDADSTSVSGAVGAPDKDAGTVGRRRGKAGGKRQVKPQAGTVKRRRVGQKVANKANAQKEQNDDGGERAVIGPDCVSYLPDGTERFGCQLCPKQCRFPNGLKLHLMLKHHIRNITVEGVDTRKWGKGLPPGDIKNRKKKPVGENQEIAKEEPVKKTKQESKKKTPASTPKAGAKKGVFLCHLCNRRFMYATWRDKHLLRHTMEESKATHLCPDCPRRFVTVGDLTKHKLTHRTKTQNHVSEPEKSEPETSEISDTKVDNHKAVKIEPACDDSQTETNVMDKDELVHEPALAEDLVKNEALSPQNKMRNIVTRQGMLKKTAICRICGIQFVSSSNMHRHLRKRHGLYVRGKRSNFPKDPIELAALKAKESGEVVESVEDIKPVDRVEMERTPPPPSAQDTVLNIPKVSITQTKDQMKTMASMTRLIRRKHATAVLQNMIKEKQIGGETQKGDGNHMRAKLYAALRQSKSSVRKQQQGFRKIEQVALKQHKEVPSSICPWQSDVKPQPFIPKKPPGSDVRPQANPGPSTSSVEVLDLRVKRPRTDGQGSSRMSSVAYVSSDTSQPLDLSCHARPIVEQPVKKSPAKPKKVAPPSSSNAKTITRFNITPRMKSTGWKSSTLSSPLDSLDQERTTKFSVLDAAITCNVCELPFDSMKLLTQHVVAHAEDYPYKCEFCVKVFETPDSLASHRFELHRVGKMYCCSQCQQEFAYLSNLKQHQADMHSDEMCAYTERGPEEIRPQNFTDPTKAIQTAMIMPEPRERISLIAHEMSKAKSSPAKSSRFSSPGPQQTKQSPRKQTKKKKDVPFNPQRHHPFAHAREIGYLSTLPTDDKQTDEKCVSHFEMATNNRCTKCGMVFPSMGDLHVHIMECASASAPTPKTPAKTPVKTPVKTLMKTPMKTPSKSAEKKQEQQQAENKERNMKARKLKMQAARKSRSRALQKANESDETDMDQKPKRARPGLKMYNPLNHTRRRASANIEDAHGCQGCGKKFHFINGLERHMKLCPNKDKLFKSNKNPNLLPQNMNHQCAYCARQFVYLRSLKKHISSCPVRPANAPTNVPSAIIRVQPHGVTVLPTVAATTGKEAVAATASATIVNTALGTVASTPSAAVATPSAIATATLSITAPTASAAISSTKAPPSTPSSKGPSVKPAVTAASASVAALGSVEVAAKIPEPTAVTKIPGPTAATDEASAVLPAERGSVQKTSSAQGVVNTNDQDSEALKEPVAGETSKTMPTNLSAESIMDVSSKADQAGCTGGPATSQPTSNAAATSLLPRKPRRRRRRADPYGKKKKKRSRSSSPRTSPRSGNEDEEDVEDEDEEDEEEEEEEEEVEADKGQKQNGDLHPDEIFEKHLKAITRIEIDEQNEEAIVGMGDGITEMKLKEKETVTECQDIDKDNLGKEEVKAS